MDYKESIAPQVDEQVKKVIQAAIMYTLFGEYCRRRSDGAEFVDGFFAKLEQDMIDRYSQEPDEESKAALFMMKLMTGHSEAEWREAAIAEVKRLFAETKDQVLTVMQGLDQEERDRSSAT